MEAITNDMMLVILSFLPAREVLDCKWINRRTFALFSSGTGHADVLYRQLCAQMLPGVATRPGESWLALFYRQQAELGPRYFEMYAPVALVWQRLERWFQSHSPRIAQSLMPGLSAADARRAQQELPNVFPQFPVDFFVSTLIHEGQVAPASPQRIDPHGMFGGFSFYDVIANVRLLPALRLPVTARGALVQGDRAFVPFAYSQTNAALLFFDQHGAVYRQMGDNSFFEVAPSFLSMLQEFAGRLESGVYEVEEDGQICRFPRTHPLNSDSVSHGIRIRVSTLFYPENSSPGQYFFAYQVTMSCASPVLRHCRLKSRLWRCTDGHGEPSIVRGPGVIGQFPDMFVGAPDFCYESCTQFEKPFGRMEGHFEFEDVETSETFQVQIDPFGFDMNVNFN